MGQLVCSSCGIDIKRFRKHNFLIIRQLVIVGPGAPAKKKKKQLKVELPYKPVIPLLDVYPEKTIIQKDTCAPMFIAALFTIARSWKQPKCPSTNEWIKKMWYIYTMEYYSAIKKNEIGSFVEMWMNLETVIQSEVSQKEKNKYRILTHICGI